MTQYLRQLNSLPAAERCKRLRNEWPTAIKAACEHDALPQNTGNTIAGGLLTSFLIAEATTKLPNRWAPLMAFTRDFSADTYKPLATAVGKYVNATTPATSTTTSFEVGGDTIDAVSVTMNHWFKSFSVTQAELDSGLRMANLIDINVAGIADAVIKVATAPITGSNFLATPLTCSPTAFGVSDLQTLWAQLQKSSIKNILLDGTYLARIINSPHYYQTAGTGQPGGWQAFGWDGIYQNTEWSGTGAGEHITGFACNPQAILVVAGLPVKAPESDRVLTRTIFTVPGIEMSVAIHSWFSVATRTAWASFDLMLGSSLLDASAGVLIKSQ